MKTCGGKSTAGIEVRGSRNVPDGHFAQLRGHEADQWADVDVLVVVGCPQPGEREIERMARALWHTDKDTIKTLPEGGKYHKIPRGITMADGTSVPSEVKVHPDQRCTLILDQIRNETMQAIGRARLVHRDSSKPCEVILCTPYPTQLPIHEIRPWNEAVPDLLTLLVARGIVPESWRDIEAILSDVIEAEKGAPGDAARKAFERAGLPGPADLIAARIPDELLWEPYYRSSSGIRMFSYRVAGRRKGAKTLIDLSRHPEPRAALEAMLGPLDRFEAVDVGAVRRAAGELASAPPLPPPGAVAETEEVSDLVAPEPSQPEPPPPVPEGETQPQDSKPRPVLVPKAPPPPEPATLGLLGFGIDEDPDCNEWGGWPGQDPARMPRLVASNSPPKPPALSEAELIRLLPPKLPGQLRFSWEVAAHDRLHAHRVEWFTAQRLVRQQVAGHDWRPARDLSAAPIRGSP